MRQTKLFASCIALAVLATPACVLAQSPRYPYREDGRISYYELRRIAYDEGYREGVRIGERDALRGDRFRYQDERGYQRGDQGYYRGLGDRERYRQIFREGYLAGYSDGYSRGSRYSRSIGHPGPYPQQGPYAQQRRYGTWGAGPYGRTGYYSPAFENGARDGYEKGLEDRRKNRSFDPLRHSWYRSGDRDYEGRYGPREQYKDIYRRGFQEGYERGYRLAQYW